MILFVLSRSATLWPLGPVARHPPPKREIVSSILTVVKHFFFPFFLDDLFLLLLSVAPFDFDRFVPASESSLPFHHSTVYGSSPSDSLFARLVDDAGSLLRNQTDRYESTVRLSLSSIDVTSSVDNAGCANHNVMHRL